MKDLPTRKNIRLKDYNYSQAGYYFVTICIKDRCELLGQIVGDAALGVPRIELSDVGQNVKKHIENIDQHSNVTLDKYVIMPNHLHLLICVNNGTPKAASPTNAIIPKIVNALKGLTSKKFGETMWQRSYHDHIIRNEDEYHRIWKYIDENPVLWQEDCYYTP